MPYNPVRNAVGAPLGPGYADPVPAPEPVNPAPPTTSTQATPDVDSTHTSPVVPIGPAEPIAAPTLLVNNAPYDSASSLPHLSDQTLSLESSLLSNLYFNQNQATSNAAQTPTQPPWALIGLGILAFILFKKGKGLYEFLG